MSRTTPAETKLVICVWHPFTEWRPKPAMAEAIRNRWPAMRVLHLPNYDHLAEELPDTDIFIGYSLRPELLALARNFPDSVRGQDRARWAQQEIWDQPQHLTELNGKVLLIVGYGSIGREVAKRAKAFDMQVWGVTRSGKGEREHVEKIFAAAQLSEALPSADYVLICAPETAETKYLIGAAEITKMKRGARLINVGRGSLLDEAALVRALENGALGGAALDVAATEPLPPESPLWKAPNLFITPHTSGVSDRLWDRQAAILIELLERWFDGQELFNQVDFARGY